MLKSTHKPSVAPLPPGWTEHKAPTGHSYYHNASTGESTYTRPGSTSAPTFPSTDSPGSFLQTPGAPSLADPAVANAFLAQYHATQCKPIRPERPERPQQQRPKPQPKDTPASKAAIPGCEPWFLVFTKYRRRFAYNSEKNTSYWRIPDKLKEGILKLDQERIRAKVEAQSKEAEASGKKNATNKLEHGDAHDDSEYEEIEVEVTDDEDGDNETEGGRVAKRHRTAEPEADPNQPVEFSEADIAFQLQAMGADYGGYDEGGAEKWHADGEDDGDEDGDGALMSEQEARATFKDLLDDLRISPFSPWDRLVGEGKMIDDPRYTILDTMKARKEAWEEWSSEKIRSVKEIRATEAKKHPKVAYMAFLQEKATPKLYWPEFKRKYRKEDAMKDLALSDKDREKLYREHINRLKLPVATLKSDLKALLKEQTLTILNNQSTASALRHQIVCDPRYISLAPRIRDSLVENFIQGLPPPPEDEQSAAQEDAMQKNRERRDNALRALEEHRRRVESRNQDGSSRTRAMDADP